MKLSALNGSQKNHFVWRMDVKTSCGLIRASQLLTLSFGDMEVEEAFVKFGLCTERVAKNHAKKVIWHDGSK